MDIDQVNVLKDESDRELFELISPKLSDANIEEVLDVCGKQVRNDGECSILYLHSSRQFLLLSVDKEYQVSPYSLSTVHGLSQVVEKCSSNPSLFSSWLYVPVSENWFLVIDMTN